MATLSHASLLQHAEEHHKPSHVSLVGAVDGEGASGKRSLDALTSCETREAVAKTKQRGSKTKQRRVTATLVVADNEQTGAAARSTSESFRAMESNASVAQRGPSTKRRRATNGDASAAQSGSTAVKDPLQCSLVVNAPVRSVEQPVASHLPSSLEQSVDAFTSIKAVAVWLTAQSDESSSPELLRCVQQFLCSRRISNRRRKMFALYALNGM